MNQHQLSDKLQEKLGFQANPARANSKVISGGTLKAVKSRRRKSTSIQLAPPDGYLNRDSFLSFNLKQPALDPQQVTKVEAETGLPLSLQKDLAECRLDSEVARLLFYCFRMVVLTRDNITIKLVCDYIEVAKEKLPPPKSPDTFWSPKRRRYLSHLNKLRSEIQRNRRLAENEATERCISDFLKYLEEGWGLN
jgi:hypothetical protein